MNNNKRDFVIIIEGRVIMKLNFIGKNMEVGQDLKDVATKKLSKLDKFFAEDVKADVMFKHTKKDRILEVTVFLPDGAVLRSEQKTDDFYNAIDKALNQLERQVRKHKTKLQKKYRDTKSIRFETIEPIEEIDDAPKIVREKSFELVPMTREEAILQMELVVHDFYLFLDADTNKVSVLYKRGDGNYGIIMEG